MAILGILMNSKNQIYIIFFPILIVNELGFSESTLGILLVLPVFMRVFQFIFGKIGDYISEEFGVLVGILIAAGSIFFLPYAQSFEALILILFMYGLGGGIWNVNAWALMGEVGKKENIEGEIVGSYMSIAKVGVFISTLISATLVSFLGVAETIQLFAILILVGNVIAYLFFKPIFHHPKYGSYFEEIK